MTQQACIGRTCQASFMRSVGSTSGMSIWQCRCMQLCRSTCEITESIRDSRQPVWLFHVRHLSSTSHFDWSLLWSSLHASPCALQAVHIQARCSPNKGSVDVVSGCSLSKFMNPARFCSSTSARSAHGWQYHQSGVNHCGHM